MQQDADNFSGICIVMLSLSVLKQFHGSFDTDKPIERVFLPTCIEIAFTMK